jgi:hypothetical protein
MPEGHRHACQMDGCSLQQSHVLSMCPDLQMRDQISQVGARVGGGEGAGDRALGKPWAGPEVSVMLLYASASLPLTWVAPAAAGTTTLSLCHAPSGPGSDPDRVPEASGGAEWKPSVAAAAHTGSRPVHPEACASAACMLLSLRVGQECSRHHAGQITGSRSPRSATGQCRGRRRAGRLPRLPHSPALSTLGPSGVTGLQGGARDCAGLHTYTPDTTGSYSCR